MKLGARPKPTKLKQLEGDAHKERWNPNEPKPVVAVPTCPSFLTGSARNEWKRIVPELEMLGLLTNLDRAALAAYCQCYGRWADAEKELNRLSALSNKQIKFLYKTTSGNLVINPLLSVANHALDQMKNFLIEFGMTPSSRTRITTTPGKESGDPMEDLLSGNRVN